MNTTYSAFIKARVYLPDAIAGDRLEVSDQLKEIARQMGRKPAEIWTEVYTDGIDLYRGRELLGRYWAM